MNPRIAEIVERIRHLEAELETELAKRRLELAYSVHGRVVRFEEHVLKRHRDLKVRLSRYILGARPLLVLTAPVIYAQVIPMLLLDLFVTFYQAICFPVYGIAPARRHDYLIFDRGHLAYLNGLEKINCSLLFVRERTLRICSRGRRPHRAVLVSDQACTASRPGPRAVPTIRGLWGCGRLPRRARCSSRGVAGGAPYRTARP